MRTSIYRRSEPKLQELTSPNGQPCLVRLDCVVLVESQDDGRTRLWLDTSTASMTACVRETASEVGELRERYLAELEELHQQRLKSEDEQQAAWERVRARLEDVKRADRTRSDLAKYRAALATAISVIDAAAAELEQPPIADTSPAPPAGWDQEQPAAG